MNQHIELLEEHKNKKQELLMKQKLLEQKARLNSKNYQKKIRDRSTETRKLFSRISNTMPMTAQSQVVSQNHSPNISMVDQ